MAVFSHDTTRVWCLQLITIGSQTSANDIQRKDKGINIFRVSAGVKAWGWEELGGNLKRLHFLTYLAQSGAP